MKADCLYGRPAQQAWSFGANHGIPGMDRSRSALLSQSRRVGMSTFFVIAECVYNMLLQKVGARMILQASWQCRSSQNQSLKKPPILASCSFLYVHKLVFNAIAIVEASSALIVHERCASTIHAWSTNAFLLQDYSFLCFTRLLFLCNFGWPSTARCRGRVSC